MTQNIRKADNEQFTTDAFINFLGCKIECEQSEMVRTRVAPAFLSAFHRFRFQQFDEDCLRTWFVTMVIKGMKFNQAKRYVGALHTVFTNWNSDKTAKDPFVNLIADLSVPILFDRERASSNLVALRRLIDKEPDQNAIVARNVFLYLLFLPEVKFEDVVRVTLADANGDCPQIADVISNTPRKARATYVFPLNQGNTTDRKIITTLQSDILSLLKEAGIGFDDDFSRESISSLWIANALECGIAPSVIRGLVETLPKEYEILTLVNPVQLTESEKHKTICKVANHINDTTVRWFIMRMREKVTPDIVKEEIKNLDEDIFNEMYFYYPTYKSVEIDRKGKRKTVESPYLPGILFIRLRSDKVGYVVRRITKYAWCYKYTRTPDSPYSFITQKQMELFQMHIGRLTPDIRITLDEREQPYENDTEVMIAGGDRMVGHVGRITSVRNVDGTRTYSLEITNSLSAKWTVNDVEEVFLQPVGTN